MYASPLLSPRRSAGLHALCGEAVKAHRECPGDIRRSKCAARVRSAPRESAAALTVART